LGSKSGLGCEVITKNVIAIVVKDIRNYEIWSFAFAMSYHLALTWNLFAA